MTVQIKINIDNAAFADDHAGDETARILRKLANSFDGCGELSVGEWKSLLDINGNKVGKFEVIA